MNRLCALIVLCMAFILSAGCSMLQPKLEDPEVKLVGIRLLPLQGLQQKIAVDLSIANPNKQELSVRGISYSVGIENISLLTGLTDQVPVLKSHQETPVTLVVSADILQVVRLVEHFSHNGVSDNVNYNFSAVIDFSAWLPSLHVNRKGVLPLGGQNL
ncbi:MAG TPA: LEA type 2 family protein [Cellvibrio sp.]|nr:LEA type 2 family protein [Cellvibrio sp.]